jgi:PST family polysaccharide transporter
MNLKSTVFYSGLATVVRIASGLITSKAAAYFLGPSGVAFVAQFQNFLSLLSTGANLGIGHGVIKLLSEEDKDDGETKKELLSTAICISFGSALLTSLSIVIFNSQIAFYLFKTNEYNSIVMALGLMSTLTGLTTLMLQVLNGFRQIQAMIAARIAASLAGVIISVICIYQMRLYGALLALILSQVSSFVITIYFSRSKFWFSRAYMFKGFYSKRARNFSKYALMTMVSAILLNWRQVFLRDHIIVHLSSETAGIWQAVWKVSEMHVSVIVLSLSVYYLPKLSGLELQKEVRTEIYKVFRTILPIVLASSVAIYFLRGFILSILFTSEFERGGDLFLFQLLGDVFKISAWLISFQMIAKGMYKEHIFSEVLFFLGYIGISIYLLDGYGVLGVTYAHAIIYFLYLLGMVFLFRGTLFNTNSEGT